MIKCPKCSHEFKNPEKVKGGKADKTGKRDDLKVGGKTWLRIHRPDCRINPGHILTCNLGTKCCYINHK
jgi:hypothetical protein